MAAFKQNTIILFNTYILYIIEKVEAAYRSLGYDCVVTSGMDGTHMATSLHYQGKAVDFRIRHVRVNDRPKLVAKCKELLGPGYDVILETECLHIEHDPKPVSRV